MLGRIVSQAIHNGAQGLSCRPSSWASFQIDDEVFDRAVSLFPGAVSIHFPIGYPLIGDNFAHWPSPQSFAHYEQALLHLKPLFDGAKRLLVIGRVARGGASSEQDAAVGVERMDFARKLLAELYKDDDEPYAISRKILSFTLNPRRTITGPFFAAHFLPNAITWDDTSLSFLRDALSRGPVSDHSPVLALYMMYQVALIIPIPCDDVGSK